MLLCIRLTGGTEDEALLNYERKINFAALFHAVTNGSTKYLHLAITFTNFIDLAIGKCQLQFQSACFVLEIGILPVTYKHP